MKFYIFDEIVAIVKPFLKPIVEQLLKNDEQTDETREYPSFVRHIRDAPKELSNWLSI